MFWGHYNTTLAHMSVSDWGRDHQRAVATEVQLALKPILTFETLEGA
jgi:hypothetical protein